jgi:NTE family protein
MIPDRSRKAAVILSGGGAKGAYQAGALKALKSLGVEPAIYSGTSVGAFNAAFMVAGGTAEGLAGIWSDLRRSDVFLFRFDPRRLLTLNPLVPLNLALDSSRLLAEFLSGTVRNGGAWWRAVDLERILLDTSPLRDLIRRHVDLEAIRRSPLKLHVVLTILQPTDRGALMVTGNHDVTHPLIHASCAMPVVFPAVRVGERVYCDGGVVMNTPLRLAIDGGAEDIYVLDLTPPPHTFKDGTLNVAYQTLSASFSEVLRRDIQVAKDRNAEYLAAFREDRLVDGRLQVRKVVETKDGLKTVTKTYGYVRVFHLYPSSELKGLEGFLEFEPAQGRRMIRQGEEETLAALAAHREVEVVSGKRDRMRAVHRAG